ncbi:MAG TPA: tRNA lysidine(34) synthetase TilS, partial [Lautropia sp.]|nr:tRNA lysidine(34) synthetase TilS [Lautropia sp.]
MLRDLTVLPDLVLAGIRQHHPSGAPPILLACSGGLDSQVLLDSAAAVWPAESLFVAHVHHGLQPEAEEWLAFCEAVAIRRGLPFLSRRLPALPVRIEGGIEAWARGQRYRALADMAADAGASLVLTAHHANDQLETHHLRRARGAGPLGLGAMRDFAPVPGARHLLLLRPFLGVGREQIRDYAGEQRLDWVEDPSNQDLRYARNRVRREMAQGLLQDSTNLQRGLAEIGEFQAVADVVRRR